MNGNLPSHDEELGLFGGDLIYVMAMIVVAGMFMLGLLYATANVSGPDDEPYCPTEDSCEPQWHNGEWHIVEVTP